MRKKIDDYGGCLIVALPLIGLLWLYSRFPRLTLALIIAVIVATVGTGGYYAARWVGNGCPDTYGYGVDVCTQTASGYECVRDWRYKTRRMC